MKTTDLYKIAEENNIPIYQYNLPKNKSISIHCKGSNAIGIEPTLNTREERLCLAHELGHCITGSFYNIYSEFDIRAKHERTANIYAVQKLIPYDDLIESIDGSCCTLFELSEKFDVPESFMDFALEYYNLYKE